MAELRSDIVLHSEETRCETEERNILSNLQPLPHPEPVDVLEIEGKGEEGIAGAPEKLGVAEDIVCLR